MNKPSITPAQLEKYFAPLPPRVTSCGVDVNAGIHMIRPMYECQYTSGTKAFEVDEVWKRSTGEIVLSEGRTWVLPEDDATITFFKVTREVVEVIDFLG